MTWTQVPQWSCMRRLACRRMCLLETHSAVVVPCIDEQITEQCNAGKKGASEGANLLCAKEDLYSLCHIVHVFHIHQ